MNIILHSLRRLIVLALLFSSFAFASALRPLSEGLPVPWPFPWAKECPVNWESMDGRYLLTDNAAGDQIDLKITIISELKYRLIGVSRYSVDGALISSGSIRVSIDKKIVKLWLYPTDLNDVRTRAVLKLYYGSADLLCSEDHLIPILTLDQPDSPNNVRKQYRLMRLTQIHP